VTTITHTPNGPRFDGMTVGELIALADQQSATCRTMNADRSADILDRFAAALRFLSEWHPIETAPRDKTIIAGYFKDREFKADFTYWEDGHWWQMTQNIPTHWRPLPPGPGAVP
jgi:hypothetical protein